MLNAFALGVDIGIQATTVFLGGSATRLQALHGFLFVMLLVGLGGFPFLHGHATFGSELLVLGFILGGTLELFGLATALAAIARAGSHIKHVLILFGLCSVHDLAHALRRWAWLRARHGRNIHLVHHLARWAWHRTAHFTAVHLASAATLLEAANMLLAFALFVGILDVTIDQCVGIFSLATRLARGAASVAHGFSALNLAADLECAARYGASARLHVCVQRFRWGERRCVNFFRSGSREALGLLLHCLA